VNFTPQQIVDALHEADSELRTLAAQFAWFKGQRDYWKDRYDYQLAEGTVRYSGQYASVKAKPASLMAIVENDELYVEIPWGEGGKVSLADMVRLSEASFDLISKAYARMETHIMILTVVNKNVMQDYASSNLRESYR
jgi:hypothetical protein